MEDVSRPPVRYQILLVGLLSLNFGVLFFDRNALNFLMPFVQPDLKLSNAQVGLLASALSGAWAIAGFSIGWLADKTGQRKLIIVVAGLAFSLCSFVSGIATSFLMLLGARLLMGFAEGGVMPISHSIITAEVAPERRGLAMGVAQNFGSNLFGSTAAALLLVWIASSWGWREAFYVAAAPGLLFAILIWLFVKPPPAGAQDSLRHAPLDFRMVLKERNILLCMAIAVLLVSYLVVCWAFMPLYLTKVRGYSPEVMSWLMATLGISATIGSFVIPGISDYVGRKPMLVAMPLIGVILPLGAMFFAGPLWMMVAIFFFGWALCSVFPLFMATVPSETVDPRHTATMVGVVMGTGEIIGGVGSPALAGAIADATSLAAPLWIMFGICIAAGLLALMLRETAPRVLARRTPLPLMEAHA